MRANLIRIGIVIALLQHSGCSWMFVKAPPADVRDPDFECTDDITFPVVDTLWAALNALAAINVVANDNTNPYQTEIILGGTAWALVSGMAAKYGFRASSNCREAKRQRDVRYGRGMAAPGMPAQGPRPESSPAPVPTDGPLVAPPAPSVPLPAPPAAPAVPPPASSAPGAAPSRSLAMRPATTAR